jgi:hypothetical protein
MKLSFALVHVGTTDQRSLDAMIGREITFLGKPGTVTRAWVEGGMLAVQLDVPTLQVTEIPAPPLEVSIKPPEIDPARPAWTRDAPTS